MKNYVLNPYLRLSQYANRYFTYDARVASNPLIEIPTRGITEQDYNTFRKLKTDGFFLEPRSETEIVNFFSRENLAVALFSSMLRQNLLKPYTSPGESVEKKVLDFFKTRYARQEPALPVSPQTPFEENDENLHMFSPRTFFNLPRDIDPRECHVGILGVPHASMDVSLGTEAAPVQFRLHSRSLCWFEIFQQGVYSEIAFEAGRPSVLCKDIVVRDCGDLDFQDLTLSQMCDQVKRILTQSFLEPGTYPLIVGGDHAITYPIIRNYVEAVPDLGLLHLDAHNDLFYTEHIVYSHAAPISNLLKHSPIEFITSFGLRTFSDKRMNGLRSVYQVADASERLRLYSLTSLKQLIMTRGTLEEELERMADRPYYLSIDLDVLSESAIGGQLSTPFGPGLEWHELFYFLEVAFRKLNIIGCDIVEYNTAHGEGRNNNRFLVNSLLLFLIDRLGRNNPKLTESRSRESRQS